MKQSSIFSPSCTLMRQVYAPPPKLYDLQSEARMLEPSFVPCHQIIQHSLYYLVAFMSRLTPSLVHHLLKVT